MCDLWSMFATLRVSRTDVPPKSIFLQKFHEISYRRLKQIFPKIGKSINSLDPGVDFHGFQIFGTRRYAEATPRTTRKGGVFG